MEERNVSEIRSVVWADELDQANASLSLATEALREIEEWDAGWNLDYAQHFRNLQGIASAALKRIG